MARILVIDDEELIREMLRLPLGQAGHEVVLAGDGVEGLHAFREQGADIVVTDILMPEAEGIETIRALRKVARGVNIIAISGGGHSYDVLDIARRLGADRVLPKPFTPQQLLAVIDELLETAP